MDRTTCALTGHRPHKFPWKYNETDSRCMALKAALTEQITKLAEAGVTDYYSGGADGVDCWAAISVLNLRAKNPIIKLHLILPMRDRKANGAIQRRNGIAISWSKRILYSMLAVNITRGVCLSGTIG